MEGGLITTAWPQPSPATPLYPRLQSAQSADNIRIPSFLANTRTDLELELELSLSSQTRNHISRGAPVQELGAPPPFSGGSRQSCELTASLRPASSERESRRELWCDITRCNHGEYNCGARQGQTRTSGTTSSSGLKLKYNLG